MAIGLHNKLIVFYFYKKTVWFIAAHIQTEAIYGLFIHLVLVVSKAAVLASLFPGPLKYNDLPSLSVPQPVPTCPPVILYQSWLSLTSNLSNISVGLGLFETHVPCSAKIKSKFVVTKGKVDDYYRSLKNMFYRYCNRSPKTV